MGFLQSDTTSWGGNNDESATGGGISYWGWRVERGWEFNMRRWQSPANPGGNSKLAELLSIYGWILTVGDADWRGWVENQGEVEPAERRLLTAETPSQPATLRIIGLNRTILSNARPVEKVCPMNFFHDSMVPCQSNENDEICLLHGTSIN